MENNFSHLNSQERVQRFWKRMDTDYKEGRNLFEISSYQECKTRNQECNEVALNLINIIIIFKNQFIMTIVVSHLYIINL